jgi:hypothetical protein
MKSLKSYLLIAVLSLSALSVAVARPYTNITRGQIKNLTVQCASCNPHVTTTQPASADKNGDVTVQLDKPGIYKISYADGPKKGQEIKTVTATKAGPVLLKGIVSLVR